MVLRVKPTPTRFPTNSLYNTMDNTPLHFIPSVCHLRGTSVVASLKRGTSPAATSFLLLRAGDIAGVLTTDPEKVLALARANF